MCALRVLCTIYAMCVLRVLRVLHYTLSLRLSSCSLAGFDGHKSYESREEYADEDYEWQIVRGYACWR